MSNLGTELRIPRSTGTHGDVLAAVGLADLLRNVPGFTPVSIREQPAHFVVEGPRPLTEEDVQTLPHAPGYAFLKPNAKAPVPAGVRDVFDYPAHKARADRYRELLTATQRKARDADTAARLQELQPPQDWRLWQALNALQGDETSNRVHCAILAMSAEQFRRQVLAELRSLGASHQPAVSWKASAVQVFTPNAAKGYSRLKPDTTDRNEKTKDQWTDPFLEWLRYRGFFIAALPFLQGKDIRLLCPIPARISVQALRRVALEMRTGGLYGRSPKLDSLAVLRLAEVLIRHSVEFHEPQVEPFDDLSLAGASPADVISGVAVTHYQSMGSSKAVSAMSVLALPEWFPIATKADADDWLAILSEHQRVVRALQDDRSDEIGLLIRYRTFLEQRSEDAYWRLVEFMEAYGPFLIRARELKRRVPAFTTTNFRRLTEGMASHLTEILQNPGFQAVATAVRRSTVSAQAQKAMKIKDYREIRYDLLPELRRTRDLPGDAFVGVLSDFVTKYNVENARRREMSKAAPANVTTEQLVEFMQLVERYGVSVVGALLCAFGSCREPREAEPEVSPDGQDEPPDAADAGTQ